ncbi:MAG: hypothetical protein IT337_17285 [Thermomicrobiales bacterium]|nr:hypothetical protein [Thermomicrobiales bacterium]
MDHRCRHRVPFRAPSPCRLWTGWLAAICLLLLPTVALAQQDVADYEPVSGHAQVIAQGVAALPPGDVVWRTVRARAAPADQAAFEERPLGFVLATMGSLLLTDEQSGAQVRLGPGEAALTAGGTAQRRSSLGSDPVSYLSIELVPADAPLPPDESTVLQPGQPFAAPTGLRDLDLLADVVSGDEHSTVPDTGNKSVILITDGTANVGEPNGQTVTLLAGEAAGFSGALEVGAASDGGVGSTAFVAALIGPEVPPAPPPAAAAHATVAPASAETPEVVATETGSVTVQDFTCPPGMTTETFAAAACAPAIDDFDITLSGPALAEPLTLGDATATDAGFVWDDLPPGEYRIAEAAPPTGYDTYMLAAATAAGDPDSGYRITLEPGQSSLLARIYNFAPTP